MSTFTSIVAGAEHVATCPSCKQWLWKVGPDSGFFGNAPMEKAMRYMASDGDTVQMGAEPPAPLAAYTEYDAQLLKGECPHCAESYWFVTAAYPEVPVANGSPAPGYPPSFICDEGYIEILDQVDGTFRGDDTVAGGWVLLRHRARWKDREIRLDVHMIGPFANGKALVGPDGVSGCGLNSGDESRRSIWAEAAALVRAVTPVAVGVLRGKDTK